MFDGSLGWEREKGKNYSVSIFRNHDDAYIELLEDNVEQTAHDNEKVETIPWIAEVVLEAKRKQLEKELERKEGGEDDVEHAQHV